MCIRDRDEEGKWQPAVNVGKPINSSYDDLSLFLDEKRNTGMFTSSRDGGDDDIYFFKINSDGKMMAPTNDDSDGITSLIPSSTKESKTEIKPQDKIVVEPEVEIKKEIKPVVETPIVATENKIESKVEIPVESSPVEKIEMEQPIDVAPEQSTVESSNQFPKDSIELTPNTTPSSKIISDEALLVKDQSLEFYPHLKETKEGQNPIQVVSIIPKPVMNIQSIEDLESALIHNTLKIGEAYHFKNIRYGFKEHTVTPKIQMELDKLVNLLKKHPNLIIEIGGHTESVGKNDKNLEISKKRADEAVKYIMEKGIEKERIKSKGYGETALLNECTDDVLCTFSDHMVNQRLEVKILGN